ncbi:MAG: tRNA-dihydrouridine synthase [Patescibacteria group bacterium]
MRDQGFWEKLEKPFFTLAPMADVTDCAFRELIAEYGKPNVFWTEFVSADGLAHPEARKKLLVDLKFSRREHPIVAQIFGGRPENITIAVNLCKKLGFDGIDINMGCPDRAVEKQCAGAAVIKDPKLAEEIILAAKSGGLPVSVKTRLGYNKVEMGWIRHLLSLDLAALSIHLRTRKEMSDVPAHWELLPMIIEMRDEMKKRTLIIGNGDVENLHDAKRIVEKYGCDGVMLGRAIFGNPWLFSEKIPTLPEKLRVMIEHTKLFEKLLGRHKNFAIMKKHFKAYVSGFDGAKELRAELMETKSAKEVEKKTLNFIKNRL